MKNLIFLALISIGICSCVDTASEVTVFIPEEAPELIYGLEKLSVALDLTQQALRVTTEIEEADVVLRLIESTAIESNDGFSIVNNDGIALFSECNRGLMYGLLDIVDQIEKGKTLATVEEKDIEAHYGFRAIKFNLPWFSYRDGENLKLHYETCRDLKYWESFLDMMVDNKFNTLTLWNMHPFIYMVKPNSFPDASPFTNEEMAEWQAFWKALFAMAKSRGIDSYVMNWNIFVSEEFSQNYGVSYNSSEGYIGSGETNELIEQYTRELVSQTIDEYDDLTGVGITLGERMGDMTSEERNDWVERTIIAGMKEAQREARLIYRAPLSADKNSGGSTSVTTEKITREAIENMGFEKDVRIEFKYNWSHGHSSPKVSIVHGGILTDTYWEPLPDKYKGIWTVRNEDFFVLRWAQPDFIRSFIANNSQEYIGGTIIGSECYIPAKDYITKEEYRAWDYAFERQWLFYKTWGNLLYNPETTDAFFEEALADKFENAEGKKLLTAWQLASNSANRFASFYQGTWDATIYSEGFTKIGGEFIDINTFINKKVLDSSYVNIQDFVEGKEVAKDQFSPLQLADMLEKDCNEALRIVADIKKQSPSDPLLIELADIEAWSFHGKYLAAKIRGGVALATYRVSSAKADQDKAVAHLTQGLEQWKQLVYRVEKYNKPVIPYQFDPQFSWRKHIVDVEADIEIALK